MPRRPHSIRRRLISVFALFAGILLLLTWLCGMVYFFWSERDDLVHSLRTNVAILATQSGAAVMFNDVAAMNENLVSLRLLDAVRWAVIVESAADPAAPRRLAQFGHAPDQLEPIRDELEQAGDVVLGLTELTVRRPIVHDNVRRGELLVNVDLTRELKNFGLILGVSLTLFLLFLLGSVLVANRIVTSLIRPIRELAFLAENIAVQGSRRVRARFEQDDEIGQLAGSFNRMLDALNAKERAISDSRDQLRELTARLRDIREEERKRISHEIHDELGQRLTAIKFELIQGGGEEARARVGAMIDATIQVVRTISWELRPAILDSLGLPPAIEWLARDFQQRMGIRCKVALPAAELELDADLVTDAFRICQELLTNITRHAHASRVDIRLSVEVAPATRDAPLAPGGRGAGGAGAAARLSSSGAAPVAMTVGVADGAIRLEVEDDGVGMPAAERGTKSLGLLGMRERCQRWGGSLEHSAGAQGVGTLVRVTFVCGPQLPVSERTS